MRYSACVTLICWTFTGNWRIGCLSSPSVTKCVTTDNLKRTKRRSPNDRLYEKCKKNKGANKNENKAYNDSFFSVATSLSRLSCPGALTWELWHAAGSFASAAGSVSTCPDLCSASEASPETSASAPVPF